MPVPSPSSSYIHYIIPSPSPLKYLKNNGKVNQDDKNIIVYPSPSFIDNNFSPSPIQDENNNTESTEPLVISLIVVLSLVVLLLVSLTVYMFYHRYKNKEKYKCNLFKKNKTTPDKTSQDISLETVNNDIESGKNIKLKNENGEKIPQTLQQKRPKLIKRPRINIDSKILEIKENPENRKSPRMVIKEKPKTNPIKTVNKLMMLTP